MNRDDLPQAGGDGGFDTDSVEAHLAAVAAHVAALEDRIRTLETERDAIRGQLADALADEVMVPDEGPAPDDGEVAARLLASKLAMEGKNRDTIVMRLAAEHEIEDPGPLVDDVLARLI